MLSFRSGISNKPRQEVVVAVAAALQAVYCGLRGFAYELQVDLCAVGEASPQPSYPSK